MTDGGAPGFELPNLGGGSQPAGDQKTPATPLAASAVTPTGPRAAFDIAGPGAADYEAAIGKLDGGDMSGLTGMTRAAELGYAPAQTYLGQLYLDGAAGVPADPAKSRQWGRRAAEGGDPRGMHLYGMQLYEGDGGATNQSEALAWLLKAAQGGLPDSQYNVARIYETGADGVAKNPTEALEMVHDRRARRRHRGPGRRDAAASAGQRRGSARRQNRRRRLCRPIPAFAADSVAGFRLRHRLRPA